MPSEPSYEFVPLALSARANGAKGARPPTESLHPVLPNATENPASEYKSISSQCQDPTSFPGRFFLALDWRWGAPPPKPGKSTLGTKLARIEGILSNKMTLMKNQPKRETL